MIHLRSFNESNLTDIIDDVHEILYDLKDSGLFYTTVEHRDSQFVIFIMKRGGDTKVKLNGEIKDTIIRINDYFKGKGFLDNMYLSFISIYTRPLVAKSKIEIKGDDIYAKGNKLDEDVTITSANLKFNEI